MQKTLIFLLLATLIFISCQKDDQTKVFQLSETTKNILQECRANPLEEMEAIRSQLIGDWKLIGYACSFCVPHKPPTAAITFTEDGGFFEYEGEFSSASFTFEWELELDTTYGNFSLKTEPYHHGLFMSNFCDGFMSHDTRAGDGALHLYEKQ